MPKQCFGNAPVPLSPAVRAGDFVYISGQTPAGPDGTIVVGGITEQTTQVMANVEAALKLAGCTLADIVKTTVWLEDARDFAAFNKVYGSCFPSDPPARTTVESRLMVDIKIEVEAVAYKPE
ncbi:RidA family protein [Pararhizobium mangrovi]|uniref:RidA family protein n=1 Tax=Pararhizobium mangrovi TaxID=2590452 RepID=A0A506UA87_9HYPH|nr:RidA family protein [Pararhizobium mangrovi]TPW30276.1 RidA family protein [Pararhizobium mangrovi]